MSQSQLIQQGQTIWVDLRIIAEPQMPLDTLGLDTQTRTHEFVIGRGDAPLPGLETMLDGRSVVIDEPITMTIPPEQAFGTHRPEMVFEAVRENLPDDVELSPGMPLFTRGEKGVFQLRVVSLTKRGAMLDGNHPLAGYPLNLDITIRAIISAESKPRVYTVSSS